MIHAAADVDEGALVGKGVEIWERARIRTGAQIGDGTRIGRNVFIDTGVQIGARCKIQNNALVYAGSCLKDGVFVGPAAVLANDLHPRAINRDGSLKSAADWVRGEILVETGASLGAGAILLPGVRIGEWAVVAAGSVVRKDVPKHRLVAGVPAVVVGWVCYCGRLSNGTCQDCGWHPSGSP
jgi:UDP-2-acetamido-3-amino-2,3-dideoxy-glucuronate N-acetyltransferase